MSPQAAKRAKASFAISEAYKRSRSPAASSMERPEASENDGPMAGSTRETILLAALDVILQKGFRRTTMTDIIHCSGLSKSTVYLHFSGREEVFRETQQHVLDEMIASCAQAFEVEAPFEEKIRLMLYARHLIFNEHFSRPGLSVQLFLEWWEGWNRLAGQKTLESRALFVNQLAQIIENASSAGEISLERLNLTPIEFARTMQSSVLGSRLHGNSTGQTLRAHLDALASIFAAAVRPDSAASR